MRNRMYHSFFVYRKFRQKLGDYQTNCGYKYYTDLFYFVHL